MVAEYCLFGFDYWSTCMQKGEWSGWVQAIGSIVAIFIAIFVSRRQFKDAMRVQRFVLRDASTRKAKTVLAVCSNALAVVNGLTRGYEGGGPIAASGEDLRYLSDCADTLQSIPLFEVPGERIVIYLAVLPRHLHKLAGTWADARLESKMVEVARERDRNMGFNGLQPLGFETPALNRLTAELKEAEGALNSAMKEGTTVLIEHQADQR
jgi:hypothetical protein